jgi:D-amino-acid oxidase
MKISIIGGGIIGFTTGVALAEAGHAVTILTRDPPEKTTSWAAGAVIYPVNVEDSGRSLGWFKTNNDRLDSLRTSMPGIRWIDWVKCSVNENCPTPSWLELLNDARVLRPDELPAGQKSGIRAKILQIDVDAYFTAIIARFKKAGGVVEMRDVQTFDEVPGDLVINCTGVFAGELTHDTDLHPARGQIVLVRDPGVNRYYSSFDSKNYIYPRGDGRCLLGGSYDELEWDLTPNDNLTKEIVAWAAALEPKFENAEILDVRVGLRPVRSSVRLEKEGRVIHNYGHGGCGYTLAWGCADDVLKMLG